MLGERQLTASSSSSSSLASWPSSTFDREDMANKQKLHAVQIQDPSSFAIPTASTSKTAQDNPRPSSKPDVTTESGAETIEETSRTGDANISFSWPSGIDPNTPISYPSSTPLPQLEDPRGPYPQYNSTTCEPCSKTLATRIYTLSNGIYCGECDEDGMRSHENPLEGSCLLLQEAKDVKGEQDVIIDGRPVICVGTPGATPSSRACLSTCNIFITLSRNPSVAQTCNENTYNAGMKCEQCIRYGGNVVLLAEEEGEGNGELKGMDFERILESLSSWCAASPRCTDLRTGQRTDGDSTCPALQQGQQNGNGKPNTDGDFNGSGTGGGQGEDRGSAGEEGNGNDGQQRIDDDNDGDNEEGVSSKPVRPSNPDPMTSPGQHAGPVPSPGSDEDDDADDTSASRRPPSIDESGSSPNPLADPPVTVDTRTNAQGDILSPIASPSTKPLIDNDDSNTGPLDATGRGTYRSSSSVANLTSGPSSMLSTGRAFADATPPSTSSTSNGGRAARLFRGSGLLVMILSYVVLDRNHRWDSRWIH